jgi:hypothetical protein
MKDDLTLSMLDPHLLRFSVKIFSKMFYVFILAIYDNNNTHAYGPLVIHAIST